MTADPTSPRRLRTPIIYIILLVLTAAAYAPLLWFDRVDDQPRPINIRGIPPIQLPGNPLEFHAIYVLSHLIATGLVFSILRASARADLPAFAGALLFALHPLQVDTIAGGQPIIIFLITLGLLMLLRIALLWRHVPRATPIFVAFAAVIALTFFPLKWWLSLLWKIIWPVHLTLGQFGPLNPFVYFLILMPACIVAEIRFPKILIPLIALLAIPCEFRLLNWQDTPTLADATLQLDPQSIIGNEMKADYLADKHKWSAAIPCYQTALVHSPDDGELHNKLAHAFQAAGDLDSAIPEYQAAIPRLPPTEQADALCNLGIVQLESGQPDAAKESFTQAVQADPNNSTAQKMLDNLSASGGAQ